MRNFYTLDRHTIWPRTEYSTNGRRPYDKYVKKSNTMNRPPKLVKSQDKSVICLLISAHNEELVLGNTLQSAISAGLNAEHIYVVDDNSADETSRVAKNILPAANVIKVRRSGKGLAITKAAKKFDLVNRYRWIHIADADGAFSPSYFTVMRKNLRVENAAATGYIRSLPGRRISEFRAYEYTVGMELHRRIQSMFGVIPIIPGPTSVFRSDVFAQLNFNSHAITEDFDVTLQLYRKELGKIQFIPEAVAYTQDPLTTKAFIKQITRWNRGVMQGISRHNIGKKASPVDAYLTYQLIQGLLLFVNTFIWVPYIAYSRGSTGINFLATTFVLDVIMTYLITFIASWKSKRWDMMSAFPIIYGLKWISLAIFMKSFFEVMILRKFQISDGLWENEVGRRYQVSTV